MALSLPQRRAFLALAASSPLLLASGRASAVDADVTSNTAAQAYSLRSPFGDPVIFKRRITESLGLGVYNLLDNEKPSGPQIFIKLRMRFDVDLGIDSNEVNFARGDATNRYVPGLQQAPLDLMYGYIEGRHLLGGYFGFRLGRQYVTDALGWWSFDGGLAKVSVPYVNFELYGGFEQRGGLPLSSGRFEQNGVWRGDRSSALSGANDVFPMFQQAHMAPAYGFGVESAGPTWLHGRFDYRKVLNTGEINTRPFADTTGALQTTSGTRTSSERIGYAMDATIGDLAAARAGLVYDLFNATFAAYYANIDAFVIKRLTIGADYDFYRPTFDGDSIFNFFTHEPMTTLTGRVSVSPTDRLDVAGSGGIRWWETDDDPNAPTFRVGGATEAYRAPDPNVNLSDPEANNTNRLHDWLGNLSGRYRWETAKGGVHAVYENGQRGRREGGDFSGQKFFRGGKYMAEARASVFDWKDDLRPDQSATSFGYVLGGGWRAGDIADVLLEWEHNTNRIVGQRYRILALVNLLVTK